MNARSKHDKSILMLAFFVLSIVSWADQSLAILNDTVTICSYLLYQYLCLITLMLWINLDTNERSYIFKPFDYGLIIYLSCPIHVPYYFLRTRGIRGAFMTLLMVSSVFSGWLIAIAVVLIQHWEMGWH
jgi:hypothetical protein